MSFAQLETKTSFKYIRSFSFYLMLFLCVFIPFRSPISDLTTSLVKSIPDILILGVFVWYSIIIRFRYRFLVQDFFLIGFFAICLVSSVFINHVPISIFILQSRSIALYYVFYFIIRNFEYGEKEYLKVTLVLEIVLSALFVLGVIEKITSKTVLFPSSVAESISSSVNFSRIYTMLYNPNTFALFVTLVFFLCVFKWILYKKKTSIIIYAIIVCSLFLSMSRSSLILLGIGIIAVAFIFILQGDWKKYILKVATSVVLIGVISVVAISSIKWASSAYYYTFLENTSEIENKIEQSLEAGTLDRLDEMTTSEIVDKSAANGRVYSVKKGLSIFKDYPIFGTGFGTYGSGASQNWTPPTYEKYDVFKGFYSDNEYIKILVETGIVGAVLFLCFLMITFLKYRHESLKVLLCVSVAWFGLFYNIFEIQIGMLIVWSILAFKTPDLHLVEKIKSFGKRRSNHVNS